MSEQEQVLTGGNSTVVTRAGDTVRRRTGSHSPAVHAFLRHLEEAGFSFSPRFLGLDEKGREVLTYLDGIVGNYPMSEAIRSREAMETSVAILRDMHDRSEGLTLPAGHARHLPEGAVPEIVCHWDAAPYNFVFQGSRAVGLIDFDQVGPGRRIDDLAYFAYRFAPLCSDENFYDGGWSADIDRWGRLARIFELYPDPLAHTLPDLIIDRLESMKTAILTHVAASEGGKAGADSLASHVEIYTRDQVFVDRHRPQILDAVG